MLSTEVKRTLVKSPPELWAELSDPARLEHHLGELGEIRITTAEAEKLIEWEADLASGRVQMKPSGWGTQVLLSVTREPPVLEPEPPTAQAGEPEGPGQTATPLACKEKSPADECPQEPDQPVADVAPGEQDQADEPPEQVLPAEPDADPQPQPIAESHLASEASMPAEEPEPRRAFFARLFGRRRKQPPVQSSPLTLAEDPQPPHEPYAELEPQGASPQPATVQSEPELEPPPEPAASSEALAAGDPEPLPVVAEFEPPPQQEPATDAAADLTALEAQMAEQDGQMLTAMLDRLGAAHHRPFSRG